MAKIGDERYVLTFIDLDRVEAAAKGQGWKGGDAESLFDFCEPNSLGTITMHKTLDEAKAASAAHFATGKSFFGACIIDHEVYEQAHDDRGRRVKGASWEPQKTYEITDDADCIVVEA